MPENTLRTAVRAFERRFVEDALAARGWNVKATARALGVPLSSFKYKIRELGLRRPGFQDRLDAGIPTAADGR